MTARILVVDDSQDFRHVVSRALERAGYVVHQAESVTAGRRAIESEAPELCVLDHMLPDGTSLDLLPSLREGDTPAIICTGFGSILLAVEAVKAGAETVLTKPVEAATLLNAVERALEGKRMRRVEAAERRPGKLAELDPFVGSSPAIRRLAAQAQAVANADAPVLVTGETGTGKGVLARWLHEHGPRARQPFVDLNCAGLSRELAESELFGHRRGSFTSAVSSKQGLMDLANRGTLFLDEIGDLDVAVQPKLLKVLEEGTYRALGDTRTRVADVRLVAATHRDLPRMAEEGAFRLDLLFRINTVVFQLPSLRERREDLPTITEKLLDEIRARTGQRGISLSPAAVRSLQEYDWPGNLRELKNVLERSVLLCRYGVIEPQHLALAPSQSVPPAPAPKLVTLRELERQHILSALAHHHGHVGRAAQTLGIARSSLYSRVHKLGIETHGAEQRS